MDGGSILSASLFSIHTLVDGSNNTETPRFRPFILSEKVVKLAVAVPLNSGGRGSNSSNNSGCFFFSLPYTCFSNCVSEIFMVASFLFLGTFHLHMYDVTGNDSSTSVIQRVEDG